MVLSRNPYESLLKWSWESWMIKFQFIFSAFIFLSIFSCAKTEEAAVRSAIQEAKYFLNTSNCSSARSVLEDVDFQEDNASYISTYASAQACVAGYKELDTLFGGNLSNISSASLITSLAAFTSSDDTVEDSEAYTALDAAITTLISYDGTTSPSTVARNSKFGTKQSGDLSMQAMYLLFVQIGKHFALYGNAEHVADPPTGVKGGGAFGNSCLYSYTTQDAVEFVTDAGALTQLGSCISASGTEGSDFLEAPETAADIKRRLCQGIVYFNNLMDILSNMTLPGSDSLGDVSNIGTALSALMLAAQTAETSAAAGKYNDGDVNGQNAIAALKDVTSQAVCEAVTIERIEKFYAIFFEAIYQ